jgi:hypothetical protein
MFGAGLSIGAGCLVFALAFVLIPVVALAGYFLLGPAQTDIARRAFPSGVELGNVLHQQSASGIREGCVLVIFRLRDQAARSLEANSAAYLEGLEDATQRGQLLSVWAETPAHDVSSADDGPLAYAAWSCSGGSGNDAQLRRAVEAAALPGSYYATYANGEGMLLLIPSERIAVFLYYG